jgi:hypothetical protein
MNDRLPLIWPSLKGILAKMRMLALTLSHAVRLVLMAWLARWPFLALCPPAFGLHVGQLDNGLNRYDSLYPAEFEMNVFSFFFLKRRLKKHHCVRARLCHVQCAQHESAECPN